MSRLHQLARPDHGENSPLASFHWILSILAVLRYDETLRTPSSTKGQAMLDRQTYFIREHVGMFKLSDTYDILDPESQEQLGIAKEKPGTLMHVLRLIISKQMLPTAVFVYEGDNHEDESQLLFSIHRGAAILPAKVKIKDADGNIVGYLKGKWFSLGGAFRVFDAEENEVAEVKGDWKGWNFRFLDHNKNELGTITKKWAGIGKELFTTADNYIISLKDQPSAGKAILLLAAGLAVDTVYKEHG